MIVAGFGFRKSASVESLQDVLERARKGYDPTCIATADDKVATSVFRSLAELCALPRIGVPEIELIAQATFTQSLASKVARHTGSVAEASALAAAGGQAKLLVARVISGDGLATCALAQGDGP